MSARSTPTNRGRANKRRSRAGQKARTRPAASVKRVKADSDFWATDFDAEQNKNSITKRAPFPVAIGNAIDDYYPVRKPKKKTSVKKEMSVAKSKKLSVKQESLIAKTKLKTESVFVPNATGKLPIAAKGKAQKPLNKFVCLHPQCLREFNRKTELTNHVKAHSNSRSRSIRRALRKRKLEEEKLECQMRQGAVAAKGDARALIRTGTPPQVFAMREEETERHQAGAVQVGVKTDVVAYMSSVYLTSSGHSSGKPSPTRPSTCSGSSNGFDLSPLLTLGLAEAPDCSDLISCAQALQLDIPRENTPGDMEADTEMNEEASKVDPGPWIPEQFIFPLGEAEAGTPSPEIPDDEGPGMWATPSLAGFPGFAPFPQFPNDLSRDVFELS